MKKYRVQIVTGIILSLMLGTLIFLIFQINGAKDFVSEVMLGQGTTKELQEEFEKQKEEQQKIDEAVKVRLKLGNEGGYPHSKKSLEKFRDCEAVLFFEKLDEEVLKQEKYQARMFQYNARNLLAKVSVYAYQIKGEEIQMTFGKINETVENK